MKLRVLILVLLILVMSVGSVFAADQQDSKKADWQYIITRNNISYSVDMNSVKFPPKNMLFFSAIFDNYNTEEILLTSIIVNTTTREYRFEEGYTFDRKDNIKSRHPTPSNWMQIGQDSPMEHIVYYIFEHHPSTKDKVPKRS